MKEENGSEKRIDKTLLPLRRFCRRHRLFRYSRCRAPSARTENKTSCYPLSFVSFCFLVQNLHFRVLLSEFLAQHVADLIPGLALLLAIFNELICLKQRRGADLAAEKADALIPCQQLELII